MTSLWVLGLYALDHLYYVESLPDPEASVMAERYLTADGGKGANQAVCAARLGADVQFVAHLGRDSAGEQALRTLERAGVGVEHVLRDDQPTASSAIVIDRAGRQTITTHAGGAARLSTHHVRDALRRAPEDAILSLQGELGLDLYSAARQAWRGPVVVNPSPLDGFLGEPGLLEGADWLIANRGEAAALSHGRSSAAAVAHRTGARGVVVTGSDTVRTWTQAGGERDHPVPHVTPVDTTGAGDAFAGGFLSALAAGGSLDDCLDRALRVSAFSVQREGCIPSYPRAADLS